MDTKWLLMIGAGVYLLYQMGWLDQFLGTPTATGTPTTGAGAGAGAGVTTIGPTNTLPVQQPVAASTTRQLMLSKAEVDFGPNPLLGIDHWNWYFQAVRGTPGPGYEDTAMNFPRDYKMSIDQWYAVVSATPMFQGGIGKVNGMGALSNEGLQRQFVRSGGGATSNETKLVN
jgi:hypothetical protein